jgi:hypothetical protein
LGRRRISVNDFIRQYGLSEETSNAILKELKTAEMANEQFQFDVGEFKEQVGYTQKKFEAQLEKKTDLETFYAKAPKMNPSRALITGAICGIRVEDIEEPLMQDIRYLDKLIDELAKGKAMEKILRRPS